MTDGEGAPLKALLVPANTNDTQVILPLADGIPPVAGRVGHPRFRPDMLFADRGFDSDEHRRQLRARGIEPHIARRYTGHGSGLGIYRWVVERTFSWLHQFRRLRTRFERRAELHEGLMSLGCGLICWNIWLHAKS